MTHPFDGISEKLERSQQHVRNLQVEIDQFFQKSGYPVLPQKDVQLLLQAVKHLEEQSVPLRFSILVGEIVHHLRSCLDHIAWHFSSLEYRAGKRGHFIEFPILESRPRDENRFTRYERKIEGITNPTVRDMIDRLQPYNAPKPLEHPLYRLNRMDITDKHRELVLCVAGGGIAIPPEVVQQYILGYQRGVFSKAEGHQKLKDNAKIVPMIAFREFGQGKLEALIPALTELHNFVVQVVKLFSGFLPQSQ